jgi:hypothetical protein
MVVVCPGAFFLPLLATLEKSQAYGRLHPPHHPPKRSDEFQNGTNLDRQTLRVVASDGGGSRAGSRSL